MQEYRNSPSASAIQKMEAWFLTLTADEQKVISELVRSALLHAADPRMASVPDTHERSASPQFVAGLTFQRAPEIIQAIAGRTNASAPPPVYKTWSCSPAPTNPGDLVTKLQRK